MTASSVRPLIARFNRLKALVIGDLMLDHFIWGQVSRISPEAPVPVVAVERETEMPGGAGNVAMNLAALGAQVHVVGLVGQDATADRLLAKFNELTIHTDSVVRVADRPTTLKSRVIAHQQQVVRVDYEKKMDVPPSASSELWARVELHLREMDVVVISDYAKGVVTGRLLEKLIPLLRRRDIPITVDPKQENFRHYRRVTCLTPNLKEAMEGAGVLSVRNEEEIDALGETLLKKLHSDSVLITRGETGMSLFEKNRPAYHIPTRAQEVFDVTGAGDTVISTFSLAVAAGASLRAAAELSNYAAGIVVGKLGTSSVSGTELLEGIRSHGV